MRDVRPQPGTVERLGDLVAGPMRGLMAIRPFGDSALIVDVDGESSEAVSIRAQIIADAVRSTREGNWGWPVAAFGSILVPYDPEILDRETAARRLEELLAGLPSSSPASLADPRILSIPVRYGGNAGPDLNTVAARLDLTPEEVVQVHCSVTYRVLAIGFAPGFAYLGDVPADLRLPRLDSPRPRVPPGSVAVAGSLTAVYPSPTPGGWHLIGHTDANLWDLTRHEPSLLSLGDRVRFVPDREP